nr:laccase-12-like protein [Ipomoea batatas]
MEAFSHSIAKSLCPFLFIGILVLYANAFSLANAEVQKHQKEHFGGMPTAHGSGQLSMELLSSTQGQGNPIHSLSLQEKRRLYMVIVIRQAQKTGAAPNISNAFTINGQPGDLYQCSSQGTLTYWLRCRPESCRRSTTRADGIAAAVGRHSCAAAIGKRKREEKLQEPFECLSAAVLGCWTEGFRSLGSTKVFRMLGWRREWRKRWRTAELRIFWADCGARQRMMLRLEDKP